MQPRPVTVTSCKSSSAKLFVCVFVYVCMYVCIDGFIYLCVCLFLFFNVTCKTHSDVRVTCPFSNLAF